MKAVWQRLTKREKALVAATLAILALVLGRYLLVSPLIERREWVKSQLEIQPQLLEKNLRYVNQKAEIQSNLEKSRAEIKALEATLLAAETPSVSASDLQQAVQNLAAKEGTQVISTRVLNPEAMGTFTKIPIQMEVSGQIDQVANLIKALELSDKLLVVNELTIRSLFTPGAARPQAPAQLPAQSLRASLIVSGFARAPGAAGEKADVPSGAAEKKAPGESPPRK